MHWILYKYTIISSRCTNTSVIFMLYPIIVWIGMPNVVATLQCTDRFTMSRLFRIHFVYCQEITIWKCIKLWFFGEDPYVPTRWAGVPASNYYQYAICSVWSQYNTTTRSFGITAPYLSCKYKHCMLIWICLHGTFLNLFFVVVAALVSCMVAVTHRLLKHWWIWYESIENRLY